MRRYTAPGALCHARLEWTYCRAFFPLSRDQGANPTNDVNARPSHRPSSGRYATSVAAVSCPTPGTIWYSSTVSLRRALHFNNSLYSPSSRSISLSSHRMCRLVDFPTPPLTPLSRRLRSRTRCSTSWRRLLSNCRNSSRSGSTSGCVVSDSENTTP